MIGLRIFLNRLLNLIGFLLGLVLVLRIGLRYFSANPQTPFVSWIYSVSNVLIYPFRGIFSDVYIGGVVDLTAFVTIVVYGIIISVIAAVINTIVGPSDFWSRRRIAHTH